jgi:inhibitor of cysteine peptidase
MFALLGLATACGGGDDDDAALPTEVQLTGADDGAVIQLALGGQLIVALASNLTTGFSWSVGEDSDAGLVLQGEPRYAPAGSTSPVVGAGGTEVFSFKAQEPGTSHLILEYKRPFEPGVAPEQTFGVTVEIR